MSHTIKPKRITPEQEALCRKRIEQFGPATPLAMAFAEIDALREQLRPFLTEGRCIPIQIERVPFDLSELE